MEEYGGYHRNERGNITGHELLGLGEMLWLNWRSSFRKVLEH